MKAREFLAKATEVLTERGGQYESGQEENSMAEIVSLHADLTPDQLSELTELEGWFFMLALKLVRLRKSIEQDKASEDSIVDLLGYTAKLGECLFPAAPELVTRIPGDTIHCGQTISYVCTHEKTALTSADGDLVIICDDCGIPMTVSRYLKETR